MIQLALCPILFCPLADVTHQWALSRSVKNGEQAVVNCYQNETVRSNMLWYRQKPGDRFKLIRCQHRSNEAVYEEDFKSRFEITREDVYPDHQQCWPRR
ncbi:hypothetical protein chiPu_0012182 [Chiloscyllium punctatum]|uniref:Ig-like domain-containing protein n=1 Tax=Chiloscyllium punctatum TaxID=137246 RepID=A0A401STL5_CHIPU|nr:hypothetical protein [Chiloscyllium punctatum]